MPAKSLFPPNSNRGVYVINKTVRSKILAMVEQYGQERVIKAIKTVADSDKMQHLGACRDAVVGKSSHQNEKK